MKCSICGYELDHKRNFIITKDGEAICEKCFSVDVTAVFEDTKGREHIGVKFYPNINYYLNVTEEKEHE